MRALTIKKGECMKLRIFFMFLIIFTHKSTYGAYPPPPCPVHAGFLSVNGASIHYELSGTGSQTIVFLSGYTTGAAALDCYRNFFCARGYKTLLIDLRGEGLSRAPLNSPFTIDQFVADVHAVVTSSTLQALGVSIPVYMVGWSMGGATTQRYAILHPTAVSKIVLMDTSPKFVNDVTWSFGIPQVELPGAEAAATLGALTNSMLPIFTYIVALTGVDLCYALNPVVNALVAAANLPAVISSDPQAQGPILNQAIIPWDGRASLASINVPTLIIYGCLDMLTPPAASIYMSQHIPNSKIVGVFGHNHLTPSYATDFCTNLQLSFFQGHTITSNISCFGLLPECSTCAELL